MKDDSLFSATADVVKLVNNALDFFIRKTLMEFTGISDVETCEHVENCLL